MEWKSKVAVITGSASGIGKEIAKKSLQLGMKVVLSDINSENLEKTKEELLEISSDVISVKTDVSKLKDIQHLADLTIKNFGRVDFLCNNAGVSENSLVWESSIEDWNWIMGVNLWSVIYGIKVFIPIMLKQDTPAIVVNTSSYSGLISGNLGTYSVTKHAVVSLSETLHQSLQRKNSKIHIAVLCPSVSKTNILESERNYKGNSIAPTDPILIKREKMLRKGMEMGLEAREVAEILFNELEDKKFYIITPKDEKRLKGVKLRMNNILTGNLPI